MRINGKITEIITSRALVSFGGFVELEGKEFEDMKNIFTYLSKEYEFLRRGLSYLQIPDESLKIKTKQQIIN